VSHKQISKRVSGMAVMMYLLGLSYGAVEIVLSSLGMGIGKTSVYRAVQAVAKQVPGLKRENLLEGYQTKAVGADVTSVRCNGAWVTVGIAVDSNVLIYERIREEIRGGRNAISAIDAGFKRALATILDSNITTFIAAAVLFYIGTGPVRGFAVTLGIGILTTVFTAFTLTRLIVAWWVRWKRPQTVPI
jgi:preprotein translocase subunit SecD